MIFVTPRLCINDGDLTETFIAASGPGGQNVNKVATAVQLRFNLGGSGLPDGVKTRLETLAGRRLANDGTIVITANRFRTQAANRADARERLFALIRAAAIAPTFRKPTRPTKASKPGGWRTSQTARRSRYCAATREAGLVYTPTVRLHKSQMKVARRG